ncbi:hypothetical protein OSB04_003270 [Centaurea solstitialis]|uniref:B box-type domain-containing protein n=1 Tax=Centaurea solstitialis TaxID=347529 RepID=A0AA38WV60_9ASTR|nr:hypothetical protein OSB04_003270 [Centaurea solstitialis]
MKINCDVCNKEEASVFCSADDAALCSACDHRVHHANILAGKHPRFSLLLPSPKDSPICDICQEKKAILFCQQDRAILCKDCDVAIHKVNEHTKNHCRFLLTGVKLSPAPLLPTAGNENPKPRDQEPVNQASVRTQKMTTAATDQNTGPKSNGSGHGAPTSSSISEYLIEMLPGWHVEDFLDSPSNFSKIGEDDPGVFWDDEVLNESMNDCFSPETMGIWVPQAPPPAAPPPAVPPQPRFHNSPQIQPYSTNMEFGNPIMSGSPLVFGSSNIINHKTTKSTGKRRFDDGNCFTVPQINPPATTFKRSRTLW